MKTKTCKQCQQEYPATAEYFHRNGKYFQSYCKPCQSQIVKKYNGRYVEKNKQYRQKNKEKISEWHKKHYQENKEKLLEQSRERYRANSGAICERTKKYREDNIEWYRAYKREYHNKNKLQRNISRGVWGCLKGKQKQSRSIEYLGCSIEELWIHLESMFQEGMTRENYGEWHVDHIRPLSSWDFEIETECKLREAWHYTNLQPLWAKDNLSKGKSWKKNK
jgi:hypothetical protein